MEQMYVIDWPHLWRLNRQWRQWMEENSEFVTPDTIDTQRYCRIECNEAADIELRNRLSKHPRNNGRENTVHEELADALMLALTALPESWPKLFNAESAPDNAERMDIICGIASGAVSEAKNKLDPAAHTYWTVDLLQAIFEYPGMNVEAELRKCWHRLAWKHASRAMSDYPEELKIWQ